MGEEGKTNSEQMNSDGTGSANFILVNNQNKTAAEPAGVPAADTAAAATETVREAAAEKASSAAETVKTAAGEKAPSAEQTSSAAETVKTAAAEKAPFAAEMYRTAAGTAGTGPAADTSAAGARPSNAGARTSGMGAAGSQSAQSVQGRVSDGASGRPRYSYESAGGANQNTAYNYSGSTPGGAYAGNSRSAGSNPRGAAYAGNNPGVRSAGTGSPAGDSYRYNSAGHEYYKGDSYRAPGGNGGKAGGGSGSGGSGKGKGILAVVLALIFGLCVGTGIWGVRHYLGESSSTTATIMDSNAENQASDVTGEIAEPAQGDEATGEVRQNEEAQDAQAAGESGQTQPEQTQPGQVQPEQTQPEQTQPGQTQPEQTQPEQTQPGQVQPGQTQPDQGQQNGQTQQPGQAAEAPAQNEDGSGTTGDIVSDAGLIISDAVTPETELTKVVSKVMPSIVSVYNSFTEEVQSFYGQSYTRQGEATGSGIIIGMTDKELLVVTNNHVVEGADGLKVQFVNEGTAEAEIKGTDANMDLAVIAVSLSNLDQDTRNAIIIATLGDSDKLKIGEQAIAIGNALGYGQSVTTGIISAKDREISDETITGTFIQTDAAINPGNSGGALVNINGDVIGINSSKIGGDIVEGMGFAIPISKAIPIIEDLMSMETKSKVAEDQQGVIGISGASVTSSVASAYNMPVGVYVAQIFENSGAANSELQEGDIITAINGQTVTSMEDLQNQLQYYSAGTEVTLTVQRQDGTGNYIEKSVKVTLGSKDTIENVQEQQEGAEGQNNNQGGRGGRGGQQNQEYNGSDVFPEEEQGEDQGFGIFNFPFNF